jgi:hypothetical protein
MVSVSANAWRRSTTVVIGASSAFRLDDSGLRRLSHPKPTSRAIRVVPVVWAL